MPPPGPEDQDELLNGLRTWNCLARPPVLDVGVKQARGEKDKYRRGNDGPTTVRHLGEWLDKVDSMGGAFLALFA